MVGLATLGTAIVAALASLFMAWAIGAGSSGSTPFAPAVGANAISVMRAGLVVGILGFAGAVLQGQNVTEAVGMQLISGVSLSAIAATVGLLTAAILVALGVFRGYPIATAFTVTGAVVGVGLALGGDPAWAKYRQIVTLWMLVPFVGGGIAYVTARLLRAESIPERWVVPALAGVVGGLVATIQFVALAPPGETASVADVVRDALLAGVYEATAPPPAVVAGVGTAVVLTFGLLSAAALAADARRDADDAQRHFLLTLGGLVAFSAGGSQVGLAIGPLVPMLDDFPSVPITALLVGGGIGLLAGSWTGAPRMIKAIAQDYSSLGPRRSIAALIPSFAIAQAAVTYGVPVSFNEIIVSAIVGSGYAAGSAGVSRRKMVYTVLAWVGSLALSLAVGYGVMRAVQSLG